jgi:hypothetical protein
LECIQNVHYPYTGNYQQILEGLASFFHTPQDEESDSPCLFEENIFADADTVHSVLTFHGLYKVFDTPWISVKIDIVL